MGLLDFDSPDTRLGLGLLAAASARSDGAGFGQRLAEAVGSVDQWRQQQQMAKMQELQMQQHRLALQQAQQQSAKQQQLEELVSKYRTPAQPGIPPLLGDSILPPHLQSGIMPTAGVPAKPAGFDREGFAAAYEGLDPIKGFAYQQSIQKDNSPLAVKKDEVLLDRKTMKPVFSNVQPEKDPTELQLYKFAQAQGYPGSLQQFILDQKKAGATTTSVKVENKMGESVAAQVGPMLKESYTAANGAAQTADAASRIIKAVDSGKVIAGPGADLRLLAVQLGLGGRDAADQIANTRQAIRGLAEMTLQGRKQMSGQGAITESESKLAEKATSGDINSLTNAEIKQLANASARAAKFVYGQHQSMMQNLSADPNTAGLAKFYRPMPMQDVATTEAAPNVVQWEVLK